MIAVIQVRKYRQLKRAYPAEIEGQAAVASPTLHSDAPH